MGFQTDSLASQSQKPEKFSHFSLRMAGQTQKLPLSLNGSVHTHMGHTRRLAQDNSPDGDHFHAFNGL